MARLRESDLKNGEWLKYAESLEGIVEGSKPNAVEVNFAEHSGPSPASDNRSENPSDIGIDSENDTAQSGLKLVVQALKGKSMSVSWGFPIYVTAAFCVLFLILTGAGWLLLRNDWYPGHTLFGTGLGLTVSALWMWGGILEKLRSTMLGSRTVDAFCWKFLPIREKFLKDMYGISEYRVVSALPPPMEATNGQATTPSRPSPGEEPPP